MTNEPEREAPTVVFEMDNSKVGEHFSVAEVGLGKDPAFST